MHLKYFGIFGGQNNVPVEHDYSYTGYQNCSADNQPMFPKIKDLE